MTVNKRVATDVLSDGPSVAACKWLAGLIEDLVVEEGGRVAQELESDRSARNNIYQTCYQSPRFHAWSFGFEGAPSSQFFARVGLLPMPQRLKRIYGFGHLHFITFSCYRRLPLLGSAHARNVFVQILGEVRDRYGFALVGFVVMPEHVHLLIGEPKTGNPSAVTQVLKKGGPFWQRRFYDFNVWS